MKSSLSQAPSLLRRSPQLSHKQGSSGIDLSQGSEAFGEDATRTVWTAAAESPHLHHQMRLFAQAREISEVTRIAALYLVSAAGLYRFRPQTPPDSYSCTYLATSNGQTASFSVPHEAPPQISSPHNGTVVPAYTSIAIVYQSITPTPSEVGIAALSELPTSAAADGQFGPETGSIKYPVPTVSSRRIFYSLVSVTRRFRPAVSGTGFHSITILYDVYTELTIASS